MTRNGGRLLVLLIVDEHSRECLLAEMAYGYVPERVAAFLRELTDLRGEPTVIGNCTQTDNDLFSLEVEAEYSLARSNQVTWNDNAGRAFDYVSSSLCHNELLLDDYAGLEEARERLTEWRLAYNHRSGQLGLGFRTPAETAASLRLGLAVRVRRFLSWLTS